MELTENVKSIVHAMAFPGPGNTNSVLRGEPPEKYLLETLDVILKDDYFGAIEVTWVKDAALRAKAAKKLKASGKTVMFCCQPVQLINEEKLIDPQDISDTNETNRRAAVTRIIGLIDQAVEMGATYLGLFSGKCFDEDMRPRQKRALARSLAEICDAAKKKKIEVVLEAFDTRMSPAEFPGAFKSATIGTCHDAAEVADMVVNERGKENFSLMIDMSHMVQMGETPADLEAAAPFLGWFHVANCVLNAANPNAQARYGDQHPRFTTADSEVDMTVLIGYCEKLIQIDYTGPIGFEVKPVGSEIQVNVIAGTKSIFGAAAGSIDCAFAIRRGFVYSTRTFFPQSLMDQITDLRVNQPDLLDKEYKARKTRTKLSKDGKLVVLAADHPARHLARSGDDPTAMGNRLDYLGRIARVAALSNIDGIMGTNDVLDDLILVNYLYKQKNDGKGFLDGKLLMGSMNRTGLAGAVHEMYDFPSSYLSVKELKDRKIDAAKVLWRFCPDQDKQDRYSIQTLLQMAKIVDDCAKLDVPCFMEPLAMKKRDDGSYYVDMNPDALIKILGVAQGIGNTSAQMWLKIPFTAEYDRVCKATTMPILMLGGASTGKPSGTLENFERGMGTARNVRGALVGRNVLFAGDDDPAAVAEAINLIVHEELSAAEAMRRSRDIRGTKMDLLTK